MSIGPERWQQMRRASKASRRKPVIRSCEVRRAGFAGYKVTIEGSNLIRPGLLLEIQFGDLPVTGLRVSTTGTVTGVVARKPESREVWLRVGADEVRAATTIRRVPASLDLIALLGDVSAWVRRLLRRLRSA
jgi:hypothetical protein